VKDSHIEEPSGNDDENEMKEDVDSLDDLEIEDTESDDVIISTDKTSELEIRTPHMQNYLLRGADLKSLSIWEYTQKITKNRAYASKNENHHDSWCTTDKAPLYSFNDDHHSRPKYLFDSTHPDNATHINKYDIQIIG